jgi:hypothetical protein
MQLSRPTFFDTALCDTLASVAARHSAQANGQTGMIAASDAAARGRRTGGTAHCIDPAIPAKVSEKCLAVLLIDQKTSATG